MPDLPEGDALSLPEGWVETSLREVGKAVTGKTPSKNNIEHWGNTLDFITPTDFKSDGKFLSQVDRRLSDEGRSAFKRLVVPSESVIVTCIGSDMGKVAINKNDCVTNQQINSIIVNQDKYDTDFIHYLLRAAYKVLRLYADGGSTMPIINKSTFESLTFEVPPLPEQKAIADMLSSFDEKIELLREQNKTLETLAQTIFKEWFVNFNYPDLSACGHAQADATGEMVDSELGEIPKGWRVGKLGEEFDITIGRTPPRKEQHWFSKTPTGKKWSSIKDIVNSGMYLFETSEYITDEAISKFNIPIIPEDTVILSFKMTVGKLAITTEDMLSNEAIAHMKIKSDSYLVSEYIYLFLHGLDFNSLGSTSSIVTAINSTMIKQIQLLIPDEVATKSFQCLIKPIFEKIRNNTSQIQNLSKTRDILLPKLMSGQVRVYG
ncbi:MAG: restriction endonuclease subunit S [Mariprofundus sp.]|nr:restriction endonuclease subunit S [Mariprofundus sp.]